MSTRSTECYLLDPQAHSLRVQFAPGHSLLLPFEQLAFAELLAGESEDALTMHFDTHEVTLRGAGLRRIESALQRCELASVMATSAQFQTGARDGEPQISAIEVRTAATADSEGTPRTANSNQEVLNGNGH